MIWVLKIDDDLSNLRLLHLPLIDWVNSIVHCVCLNGFWVLWGVEKPEEFLSDASAMAVGDFFGAMILLLGLALVLKLKNRISLAD